MCVCDVAVHSTRKRSKCRHSVFGELFVLPAAFFLFVFKLVLQRNAKSFNRNSEPNIRCEYWHRIHSHTLCRPAHFADVFSHEGAIGATARFGECVCVFYTVPMGQRPNMLSSNLLWFSHTKAFWKLEIVGRRKTSGWSNFSNALEEILYFIFESALLWPTKPDNCMQMCGNAFEVGRLHACHVLQLRFLFFILLPVSYFSLSFSIIFRSRWTFFRFHWAHAELFGLRTGNAWQK